MYAYLVNVPGYTFPELVSINPTPWEPRLELREREREGETEREEAREREKNRERERARAQARRDTHRIQGYLPTVGN